MVIVNGILDNAEKTALPQLDAAGNILQSVEDSVGGVADTIGDANATISDLKSTTLSLKIGIAETGSSLSSLGDTLKTVNLGVVSLASYGTSISNAGSALSETAAKIDNINKDLDAHGKSIAILKAEVEDVKLGISNQKGVLAKAKSGISTLFSGLRLANIVCSLMFLFMFGVLILTAGGGLIDG